MQLKTGIQRGVTLAVTALLGVQAGQNVLAEEKQWDFDSVLFTYMEGDSRVSDVSLRLEAVRSGETEEQLTLGLSVDALSGASPSGAIPTHTPQTVTTPSGNTNVYAAELPLNSFTDRRIAGQAAYLFPLGDQNRLSTGFTLSQEDDYRHAGVNASFSQDFFDRNTTISAGFGLSADSIDPVDGIPLALSNSDLGSTTTSAENKNVTDLLFGVTQILSPRSLVQLNYGYSSATGYLNDPYKIISQVNSNGVVQSNLYENRPDSRAGHNLYGAIKFDNQGDVTTFSYRYHSDDWDISSSTFICAIASVWAKTVTTSNRIFVFTISQQPTSTACNCPTARLCLPISRLITAWQSSVRLLWVFATALRGPGAMTGGLTLSITNKTPRITPAITSIKPALI